MLRIDWCRDAEAIDQLAAFFAENVSPSYISHSELQFGRARTPHEWSSSLRAVLNFEIRERVPAKPGSSSRVAAAYDDDGLVAIAFVTFNTEVRIPFLVVEDIVVGASKRGTGIGQAFLDWIFARGKAKQIKRAFLESGKDNQDAHHFFERNGFRQVSIVMMADLKDY